MDELPTRPVPKAELQIIRTRHPPAIYLQQLCELLGTEGMSLSPEEAAIRLEDMPEKDRLLLAVEGDQLIGYAHIRTIFDPPHGLLVEVPVIIVQPHRRRQGFGRRLIAAAESWATQSKRSSLRLSCDVEHKAGHALFTALGYRQESSRLSFSREL